MPGFSKPERMRETFEKPDCHKEQFQSGKIERRKYKSEFKKIILRVTNGIEDK